MSNTSILPAHSDLQERDWTALQPSLVQVVNLKIEGNLYENHCESWKIETGTWITTRIFGTDCQDFQTI